MSFFSWLMGKVESDPQNYFGVGPFKPLPRNHPFQRAAFLHDWAAERSHAGKPDCSLDESDERFFWRMALLAHGQIDPKKRCELMMDICKYWPIARACGPLFYTEGEQLKTTIGAKGNEQQK